MNFDFLSQIDMRVLIGIAAAYVLIVLFAANEMSNVAEAKGYSKAKYFLLCLFFGCIWYFIVLALPDLEKAERDEEMLEVLREISDKLNNTGDSSGKHAPGKSTPLPDALRRLVTAAPVETAPAKPAPAKTSTSKPLRFAAPMPKTGAAKTAPRPEAKPAREPEDPTTKMLRTALDFETESGMRNYLRRQAATAEDSVREAIERLTTLSDERMREGTRELLLKRRK